MGEDFLEKMNRVTVIYQGESGNKKLVNVRASVIVGESVVVYSEKSLLVIPWVRVITVEQELDAQALEEINQAFIKANEKTQDTMVG